MARNKPGKPRRPRKRSVELHASSRATGAKYTAVMRENDRRRVAGIEWPPANTPPSPYVEDDSVEAFSIPFLLGVTVPDGSEPEEVAAHVADACSQLVRDGEGWYPAMAAVWTTPTRQPNPDTPGHVLDSLLVALTSRRPWFQPDGTPTKGEVDNVATDAQRAINAALAHLYPAAGPSPAAVLPVGQDKAEAIIVRAGGMSAAIVTAQIHPSLDDDEDEPEAGAPEEVEGPPTYRFVDRLNRGWHIISGRDEPLAYTVDWAGLKPDRPEEPLSLDELEAAHGPLRPVTSPDPSDEVILRGALLDAGVKAAGSVLVALHRLVLEYKRGSSPGGFEGGSLRAGREGSWEAEALYRLAWTIGGDLDERPKRYDEEAVSAVIGVLRAWTQNPQQYVEVAENLPYYFGKVADELGGWDKVADKPFQPGTKVGRHPAGTIEAVFHYLMSQSERHRFALEPGDFA
ncbi:hypothetical protein ACIQ9R_36045 [Streptomyces sp. NPDC094447]|uniref:hypothetical protein n=1 Tax=Streptomyces sp. NPDC094447 TaxID=3366062 RepID=UPI0037F9A4BC